MMGLLKFFFRRYEQNHRTVRKSLAKICHVRQVMEDMSETKLWPVNSKTLGS